MNIEERLKLIEQLRAEKETAFRAGDKVKAQKLADDIRWHETVLEWD